MKIKKHSEEVNLSECFFVPRAGVEPARVAPLVFETSASTDSAIWASCLLKGGAKIKNIY